MRMWRGYFKGPVNINIHKFVNFFQEIKCMRMWRGYIKGPVNINVHKFVKTFQETKCLRMWRGYFEGPVNINVHKFVDFFQETKCMRMWRGYCNGQAHTAGALITLSEMLLPDVRSSWMSLASRGLCIAHCGVKCQRLESCPFAR